ncbi:hypothetical protein CPC16_009593 [Podila verticillata]|nr:hypothetical protein CPC16_009593 [Podila verticillata]
MHSIFHLKHQDRIGWIGLGEMGYRMAGNLQRYLVSRSLSMTVWNRTPAKSAKMHQKHGVRVAKSLEDLVAQSNIIFTSFGRRERLAVTPQHTYLQCPVFGRPPVAKAAKLVWVTSGDDKAIKKMCLYFTTMSKQIIHLKTTNVASACSFKLIGNFFVVGSMELLAEGLTLAEKADVSQESVLKFVEAFFPAPSWIEYSQKMVRGAVSKENGFSVELGLKDVGHMRQLAAETGASLPTADLAYNHLQAVKESGKGEQDWSSMISSLRVSSDLDAEVVATAAAVASVRSSPYSSPLASSRSSMSSFEVHTPEKKA